MKKTIISIAMILSLVLSIFVTVSANDDITIYVNEEILQCDIAPYIENGRTMVPMRKIFEALNAKVDWEGTTQTITATKDNTIITLQINNSTMYNNGVAETLDVAPVIVNSSTFVPIRAVSQSLNASVEWFDYTQTVYINSPISYSNAGNTLSKIDDNFINFLGEYHNRLTDFTQNDINDASFATDWIFYRFSGIENGNEMINMTIGDYSNGFIVWSEEDLSREYNSFFGTDMPALLENHNITYSEEAGGYYIGVSNPGQERGYFNYYIIDGEYVDLVYTIKEPWEDGEIFGEAIYRIAPSNNERGLCVEYKTTTLKESFSNSYQENQKNDSNFTDFVTMYAPDGRTISVSQSEVEAYQNVGWYLEPVTVMYAPDGRILTVLNSEMVAYQNVGWYLTPVVTMYAPDGRTIVVGEDEIYDYINVVWYRTYEEAHSANVPSYSSSNDYSYDSGYDNLPNSDGSAVYRTPSGKRYHFDPNCGGENSYQTTLQKAKNAGLTPCKKCAW